MSYIFMNLVKLSYGANKLNSFRKFLATSMISLLLKAGLVKRFVEILLLDPKALLNHVDPLNEPK